MQRFRKPGFILLLLLLAVLCIGGVELAVCSVKEPELYEQITAPVRQAAETVVEAGRHAWNGICTTAENTMQAMETGVRHAVEQTKQTLQELTAKPEPESEIASEEILSTETQLADEQPALPIPETAQRMTCFVEREGIEYVTGGSWELVYYNQQDEQWARQPYGSDHIGGYGCGPTVMAMAVTAMTPQPIDPAEMALWCVQNGHWARRQGSYHNIVNGVADQFGLDCVSAPVEELTEELLLQRLAGGELAVALVTKGHFTNSGHYILLRGVTLDGSILVADPASRERTLVAWDPEIVLTELSRSRDHGAPLWFLSPDWGE